MATYPSPYAYLLSQTGGEGSGLFIVEAPSIAIFIAEYLNPGTAWIVESPTEVPF
jgi:hypothetical protein